ncbi:hypothetical protein [Anoxybacillus flavithermus]|uniref:Uncharacterized protein n=1 Tax=Anoxybacillus flavithermus TaxID=33934 RepID=A0A178TNT0_9BACL|nr:hypothetical protein [Anoxybacillus flavithermus]OAO82604.1 hypothetical protein TAF16_0224 [Anoxybacillus flavithermus]
MDYFAVVSSRLTLEDLEFLAYLSETKADAPFKAVKNSDLIESLPFTKFTYSKISTKLKALYFIDEVTELVKQLVDEKWLEKESKGYKIIASEEELNKWRGVYHE